MNTVFHDEVKFYNEKRSKVLHRYSQKEKLKFIFTVLLSVVYIYGKVGSTQPLCIVAFVFLSVIAVSSSVSELTYMIFFFSPMYLYVVFTTIPFYNVIIFLIILKRFVFKRMSISVIPILGLIMLLIVEFLGLMFNGTSPVFNMVKFFLIIFMMIIHLYKTPEGYDNKKAIEYLILGTLVFALSFILVNFNTIISNSYRSGGLGELDPNTYGLYNLFVVTTILQQLLGGHLGKTRTLFYILSAFIIFIAGFMTLSKTYVIMTFFVIVAFMFTSKKKLKTSMIICVSMTVGIFILMQIPFFVEVYDNLISRFEMAGSVSELTTGRSDTVELYVTYLKGNAKALFLGEGIYSYFNKFGIRPHNSTLELLISWGIIGTGIFLCTFIRSTKMYRNRIKYTSKIKIFNAIPLIMLIIYMQSLTLMYQEATYAYIVMGIMLLFPKDNESLEEA